MYCDYNKFSFYNLLHFNKNLKLKANEKTF